MIDLRTGKELKDVPIVNDPQVRIYVFLNDAGKVKIGRTKDIYKRYLSLCGSNGQGNEIVKCLVSPGTFLLSLEGTMHNKFERYRIPNTEWFYDVKDPTGETLFNDVTEHLKLLFSSAGYKRCNELRKQIYMSSKGGGECDN